MADPLSTSTTSNNTPSPKTGPTLPPVRVPPAALDEAQRSASGGLPDFSALCGETLSEAAQPKDQAPAEASLQQLLLQMQLQQIQEQAVLLHLKHAVLCAAALNPGPQADANGRPADFSTILQQLSTLPFAQQAALLPHLGGCAAMPSMGAAAGLAATTPANDTQTGVCGPRAEVAGGDSAVPAWRSSGRGDGLEKNGVGKRKFHGKAAVAYLQKWLFANIQNPYPSLELKRVLARTSGLTEAQVDHWFNNARKRLLTKKRAPKKERLDPGHPESLQDCQGQGSPDHTGTSAIKAAAEP